MEVSKEDVFSLPNAVSVTGFALVASSVNQLDTHKGVLRTVAGRLLDLTDGWLARRFNQSSEFGAGVDATLDKFAGALIVGSEWQKDMAPKPALVAIVAQNVANAGATYVAQKRHPEEELKPTRNGKRAMAAQNMALGAYAESHILRESHPRVSRMLRSLGHVATAVGVGYYGAKATQEYIQRAR